MTIKHFSTASIFILIFIAVFTSCTEDKYMEWKIINNKSWAKIVADTTLKTTASGVRYRIDTIGYTSRRPNINSEILYTVEGTLADGTNFQIYTKLTGALSDLISGLKEGIPLMQNNDVYTFYVPSSLGYGDTKTNTSIPPGSVLKFRIKLITSIH